MKEKEECNKPSPIDFLLKEQCGYYVNKPFIESMTELLKKPALHDSHATYLQTSEGMMEQITYVASRGSIDLTSGDKENNLVNWLHIAHKLGNILTVQYIYESLIDAHESRAYFYEETLKEKNPLNKQYYLDETQKHRDKASNLRKILENNKKNQDN